MWLHYGTHWTGGQPPATVGDMPNEHKHKPRGVRGIDDGLCARFDDAAKRADSDRSNITRQLWAWFAGDPGAELPERPAAPQT